MQKLTHEAILLRQQKKLKESRLSLCVVLNNIRSLYNVGSIFRTSDGAGIEKIWICGITGHPPNNQISKTALGAEDQVQWEYREDAAAVIEELKQQGYEIVSLEQTKTSVLYQDFKPSNKVCLVLGNEIEGIEDKVASLSDESIEIEMSGIKNSLNVSVAFGIVAYYIKNCMK
ncbi:MAG: RNA methyltransferase [Candidatus Zapsychrus exili]|nr:RNA methyltransferase [Candidatus Zapsychrus exili]